MPKSSSLSTLDPLEPREFVRNSNDVAPEPYDLEADTENEALSRHLSRVMSHPDNLQRLESLSRVLSSRRLSVASGGPGRLVIDPEDFDLGILLKTIRQRFDEKGMAAKYCGVAFKGLTVHGIDASAAYGPSVSELFHSILNLPNAIKTMRNPPTRKILRNLNGIVKNGEMLLVIGRPGSGCSTLLKTLAGETDQFTNVEGDFSYDGASFDDMVKYFKSEIIYNPERKYQIHGTILFCFYFFVLFSSQLTSFKLMLIFRISLWKKLSSLLLPHELLRCGSMTFLERNTKNLFLNS